MVFFSLFYFFFFSSRRRHTRSYGDWSSDVCSSDLATVARVLQGSQSEPADGEGAGRAGPRPRARSAGGADVRHHPLAGGGRDAAFVRLSLAARAGAPLGLRRGRRAAGAARLPRHAPL